MPSPPAKRPDEVRALSRLAFDELDGFIGGIGAIQRGASQRAFRAVGWGAKPAELIYTGVTNGVYASVRGATRTLARGVDRAQGGRPRHGGSRDRLAIERTRPIHASSPSSGPTLRDYEPLFARPILPLARLVR